MRCLHCNKKLSLLKLAKGDDFCSPEHFDAYQFQLSKTAIQRLMGAPAEEGPKPLLIIKEETPPLDADFQDIDIHEEAVLAAPVPADQPPPYAPFAIEPFPSSEPQPPAPVSNDPDAHEPAASARELSFPVHEREATAGLLNLHARLDLSETTPLNWTSPRNFILGAEGFPRDVIRPPGQTLRGQEPGSDFRQLENLASGEPAPAFEIAPPAAAPPIEAAPPINALAAVDAAPVKPAEPARSVKPITLLPFLIAPSFRERTGPPTTFEVGNSLPNPSNLVPVLDPGPPLPFSPGVIARSNPVALAGSRQVQNTTSYWIQSTSEVPVPMPLVLAAAKQKTDLDGWHVSSNLIDLTSRAFEARRQATGAIDFVPPAPPSMLVRPADTFVRRPGPPRRLKNQPRARRTALPACGNLISTSEQPCPELPSHSCPIAPASQALQTRTVKTATLFVAPETCPLGREPSSADPPASAMEFGWRAILAKSPLAEPFSTAAWQNQAPLFLFPSAIADWAVRPVETLPLLPCEPACIQRKAARVQSLSVPRSTSRPAEWRGIDSSSPRGESPAAALALPGPRFSRAHDISTRVELLTSGALQVAVERPFSPASSAIFSRPDLNQVSLTNFPQVNGPAAKETVGLCTPTACWELRLSVTPDPAAVKFLPLREDPVLPCAKGWTRLTSLHR